MRKAVTLITTAASVAALLGGLALTTDAAVAAEKKAKSVVEQGKAIAKQALRDQIWDATKRNPNTSMPPFGRHKILTEDEIDKVVEFVWTL